MLNQLTTLEVKIGERIYKLLCAIDSPLGEVHDVLCQMKGFVVGKINEANKAEQPAIEPEICSNDQEEAK